MMTENTLYHDIVEHSVETFVAEVVARTKDGWAVSPTCPGDAVGFGSTYTVSMFRNEDTVQALKQLGESIEAKPKLTRAEILEKARAAKAANKATLDVNKIIEGDN